MTCFYRTTVNRKRMFINIYLSFFFSFFFFSIVYFELNCYSIGDDAMHFRLHFKLWRKDTKTKNLFGSTFLSTIQIEFVVILKYQLKRKLNLT